MALLEVNGISKCFGGLKAVNDVSLSVREGSVHAIIGPNGAGKSTLLNMLIAKLEPDAGSVVFNGQPITGMRPFEINQLGISRVFQTPEIFGDLTLFENVMIPAFARRDGAFVLKVWRGVDDQHDVKDRAMGMLTDFGLADKASMHASSLSRGDKRRLELAMCLVQRPKLMLLDEPTAGMARADTNRTIDLLKEIATTGITLVIIEHDMHVVFSLAETITVLAQGTVIVEDIPANIKGHPKVQEAYLGGAHL